MGLVVSVVAVCIKYSVVVGQMSLQYSGMQVQVSLIIPLTTNGTKNNNLLLSKYM